MGLLALIFSVVIDAIRPLRGRAQEWLPEDEPTVTVREEDGADPLADAPYDPLSDPPAGSTQAAGVAAARSRIPSVAHPLERHALRLLDLATGASRTEDLPHAAPAVAAPGLLQESRYLSLPGWLLVVGAPVVLVALAEALLDAGGGFLVFLLHVAILYLTVGLGAFHRRFSELQLLVGAGEERSARLALAQWIAASGGGGAAGATPRMVDDSTLPLAGLATAQAVLAAFREVFAPLFWYAVLPGAVGPVLYLFARFASCHSFPFARTAYQLLDWIPLRLAALGFALVGQFEDTVFCLRSVSGIRVGAAAGDPYLHQRVLLLPVTGGALGCRLTDAAVDAQLRGQAPELDLPGVEREAATVRPVAGLLLRSAVVWTGIYLLAMLLA